MIFGMVGGKTQERVRLSDIHRIQREGLDYSAEHVRVATVHTREDLVLLIVEAASIRERLSLICILLIVLIGAVIWSAV